MLQGVSFDDMDVALDSLASVGPGGHFFGEDYTLDHLPFLDEVQDNERYDTWKANGSKDASMRGREWCKNMLERYEENPPSIEQGIAESLREFVIKREATVPVGFG